VVGHSAGERGRDDRLRLGLDLGEVAGAAEGLGVQLVDVLGARRTSGEPAGLADDLPSDDQQLAALGA